MFRTTSEGYAFHTFEGSARTMLVARTQQHQAWHGTVIDCTDAFWYLWPQQVCPQKFVIIVGPFIGPDAEDRIETDDKIKERLN